MYINMNHPVYISKYMNHHVYISKYMNHPVKE